MVLIVVVYVMMWIATEWGGLLWVKVTYHCDYIVMILLDLIYDLTKGALTIQKTHFCTL
jgi:hypothetical protein